jgi:nitrate reductase delta subunit
MRTFRVLSALLRYPDADILAHLDEMRAILRAEAIVPPARRAGVEAFIAHLESSEPFAAESEYIEAFDRGRSTSLHLFEHIHGESRDRGQAMVDLIERYRRHGLEIAENELPDYLPLFLEFLSTRPLAEARGYLGEVVDIVALIAARLHRRAAPQAGVVDAVVALAGRTDAVAQAQTTAAREDPDFTPEALDAAWEEAPVTFDQAGAGLDSPGGCPAAGDIVARFAPDPGR